MSKKNGFVWISPDKVKTGDFRVRTSFDPEKLEDLKRSIKRRGLLAPIVVKDNGNGTYTLTAGERRLIASRQLGLKQIPAIIREASDKDSVLLEMGIENIQREDLSFYERGRWVQTLIDKGMIVTSIAEETGMPHESLSDWLGFYVEAERIKSSPTVGEDFEPDKIPLRGMTEIKTAPISDDKKAELAVAVTKLPDRPSIGEIQRATRIIEQQPKISAEEAIEKARGVTYLLPVPVDLMPKIQDQAKEWELTIQETIIRILRDYLE